MSSTMAPSRRRLLAELQALSASAEAPMRNRRRVGTATLLAVEWPPNQPCRLDFVECIAATLSPETPSHDCEHSVLRRRHRLAAIPLHPIHEAPFARLVGAHEVVAV